MPEFSARRAVDSALQPVAPEACRLQGPERRRRRCRAPSSGASGAPGLTASMSHEDSYCRRASRMLILGR